MEEVVNNDEGASTVTLQARKRKTSKQVRNEEPKPKVRSKTRAHQNWNERYLTNKKKVDTLQPDHNLPRDFIYAVRNNMHDPKVRGAAKTAGKLMVYGRGETMKQFLEGSLKYRKDCYIMANASNMEQFVPQLEYRSDDDDDDEEEEEEGGQGCQCQGCQYNCTN